LVFLSEADSYRLIGALVIGPEMEDFRLGSSVLGAMRLDALLPQQVMNKLIDMKAAQWGSVLKAIKEVREGKASWIDEQFVAKLTQAQDENAPKKKFVNPLQKKKAKTEDKAS
jgi:hypothetical protein